MTCKFTLAVFLSHSYIEYDEDVRCVKVRSTRIPDESINKMVGVNVLPFEYEADCEELPLGLVRRNELITEKMRQFGFEVDQGVISPDEVQEGRTYIRLATLLPSHEGAVFDDLQWPLAD